ncbi:hypothetical protein [Salinicoccus roseus]|uniref:RNA polymerase sigma-70 region 4 domain-containing protein n=1 Tax=Salinicoccus roseus TaxID=45670 RepID=A0A0C2HK32_9STAP|nr:hypothetical protein [Salinicoccus roseus]KIH69931.1 hypothetical protein SN16_10470 [Salinicoccus roseus]MDB0581223.1 hypothetical protein [Salinicoccus roseus]
MNYATETYSTEKIMDLINSYPYYISRLKELDAQYKSEVGGGATSQYGIDAAMPKAQGGNSDPVHNDTIRRMKMDKELNRLQAKVRYIQNRWDRITDERTALVFNLRLNGMTYQSIAKEVGISPQRAHSIMNEVCETLQD